MLLCRPSNGGINANPVANCGNFPEGNPCLRHAEGAGVHPEKNNFLFAGCRLTDVLLVRGPCILQRIIDVCYRVVKSQGAAGRAQFTGRFSYVLGDTH